MAITLNGTTGITTPAVTNDGAYTGDGISFANGTPSNTLVTDTSGNVGVGTSSPSEKLSVSGSISSTGVFIPLNSTTAIGYIGNSNPITGGSATNVGLRAESAVLFATGGATERMRIDSSGSLLIGRTDRNDIEKVSTYNGASAGYCMTVRNDYAGARSLIQFQAGASTVGTITSNGSSTTYGTSSDYRLKDNIQPMTGALATVSALKPVTYTWKASGEASQGFIAHELQAVIPEAVVGDKDGTKLVDVKDEEGNVIGQEEKPVYQAIDTSFLVATLTAAIQEQQAIITDLKSRIEALEQA